MPKIHKTAQGDTFDTIAMTYFYEETLATSIIEANPDYCDVLFFEAGVEIVIPDVETSEMPESLPPWRRDE